MSSIYTGIYWPREIKSTGKMSILNDTLFTTELTFLLAISICMLVEDLRKRLCLDDSKFGRMKFIMMHRRVFNVPNHSNENNLQVQNILYECYNSRFFCKVSKKFLE